MGRIGRTYAKLINKNSSIFAPFVTHITINSEGIKNPLFTCNGIIDTGAYNVLLSERHKTEFLQACFGCDIADPATYAEIRGVYGSEMIVPGYVAPYFCIGQIKFRDVVVLIAPDMNVDLLIGRSILCACKLVLDPLTNSLELTTVPELLDEVLPRIGMKDHPRIPTFSSVCYASEENSSDELAPSLIF